MPYVETPLEQPDDLTFRLLIRAGYIMSVQRIAPNWPMEQASFAWDCQRR